MITTPQPLDILAPSNGELDNANIDYLTLNSNSTLGAASFCSFYVQAYD